MIVDSEGLGKNQRKDTRHKLTGDDPDPDPCVVSGPDPDLGIVSVPDPKLPGGPDSDPDPQHETHLGGGSAGGLSSVYAFSRVIHPSYYALGPSTMHQNMEIFKHVNRPVPKTTVHTGRA